MYQHYRMIGLRPRTITPRLRIDDLRALAQVETPDFPLEGMLIATGLGALLGVLAVVVGVI